MKINTENINWEKKNGVLIIGICLFAMLIKHFLEYYRGTWIYHYGAPLSLFTFYGGVFWSFVNTFLLISKYRTKLRKTLLWAFLSAIPFLYISIMLIITINRTI